MTYPCKAAFLLILLGIFGARTAYAQEKFVVGLIPKAQKPIKMDGKLEEWDGAFVTPVHVGHPDFANKGGQFLFLWDEKNLYVGLRCLDQHKDVLPVGQLWLRKWTLVVDGKATPNDKLRIVTVNLDDKDRPMPFFLLGVRKGKKLELVIYAKDSEPLLVLPLKKLATLPKLPLELEWKRGEKDADFLTLNVLGKYQTVMTIAGQKK
jgi:hypothetical protein